MEGPMDDEILSPTKPHDKARQRFEEFVEQRYPGGVPPESAPIEPETEEKPETGGGKKLKSKKP
jgi:hypothetical protein